MRFSPLCPEMFVTADGQVFRNGIRRMMPSLNRRRGGYEVINHYINNKKVQFLVHRLVAAAYCEGYAPGLSVNHKNGIKTDNRVENLEWCTQRQNTQHAFRTGIMGFKEDAFHTAKLTVSDVEDIRTRISNGERNADIARIYNVHKSNISAIRRGKSWSLTQRPSKHHLREPSGFASMSRVADFYSRTLKVLDERSELFRKLGDD